MFLALNGIDLHVRPEELLILTMDVAIGRKDDVEVAAALRGWGVVTPGE